MAQKKDSPIIFYGLIFVMIMIAIRSIMILAPQHLTLPATVARATETPLRDKSQLRLLTYNVLVHDIETEARAKGLMQIMQDSDADIITVQEAAVWFTDALRGSDWARRYDRTPQQAASCAGQMILSKFPVTQSDCMPLVGRQGQLALITTVQTPDGPLHIATSHLESPLVDAYTRMEQLAEISAKLGNTGDAIIAGDFNFGDEGPETMSLPKDYKDFWTTLRKGEAGFTWDNERSDMARLSLERFPGEESRRLDWILLRSDKWQPFKVQLVGDEPIKPGDKSLFPSDHFGVLGVATRK